MESFNIKEFLLPYELSVQSFVLKFEGLKKQYRQKGLHSPMEIISGRVKSIPSIMEKLKRHGLGIQEIEKIYDIAGIRIICKYKEDIYDVVNMIKNRRDITVIHEKDYVTQSKPSGYRSYHIIGRYLVETMDGTQPLNIEFQIRTNAMHLWATVEHRLRYKYRQDIPPRIQERLVRAANACSELDEEISAIRHDIEEAKDMFRKGKNAEGMSLSDIEMYIMTLFE